MSYKSANEQSFGCDRECHALERKNGFMGVKSSQSDVFKSLTSTTTLLMFVWLKKHKWVILMELFYNRKIQISGQANVECHWFIF